MSLDAICLKCGVDSVESLGFQKCEGSQINCMFCSAVVVFLNCCKGEGSLIPCMFCLVVVVFLLLLFSLSALVTARMSINISNILQRNHFINVSDGVD